MEKEKGTIQVIYEKKNRMFTQDGEPPHILTNKNHLKIDISGWTPKMFF